jgi:hypothetical protein
MSPEELQKKMKDQVLATYEQTITREKIISKGDPRLLEPDRSFMEVSNMQSMKRDMLRVSSYMWLLTKNVPERERAIAR